MTETARITHHHDGHGLNDKTWIERDARDAEIGGGASHNYKLMLEYDVEEGEEVPKFELVGEIQFQKGPRHDERSTPGIVDGALVAVLIDRYEAFQAGPYACRENALVITKLQEALHWMKHRADDRARRGVLGHLKE